MIHYAAAFVLLLHLLFWGAGVAMLVMPKPWRRFWPVLMFPAGMALQSTIVWLGAHAGFRGTDTYAWWSEIVPLALLILGLKARGLRCAMTDVNRFGVVWASVGGCLALLVLPVVVASKGLTTLSLGSCDAADYAAGARVLKEFARSDREGFLGLTEVVRVHSVDNFYDYWLRLNHFTPSALMALNGSVLDCAPHEIATLLTAVLLAGALPVVFWVARAIIGYSGGVSVIIAGLFGISPIMWYAVAHVSPGQLIAAQAISLLTWSGVALWRGRLSWQRGALFGGVLAIGYSLILGSYNFFLLACLVPAATYAAGLAIWHRAWARFSRWLACMLLPVLACGVVFGERVAGLAERFTLLQTYDFGWPVPAFTAEGWLGMVQGPDLSPWSIFGIRWMLTTGVVSLLAWAFLRSVRLYWRSLWLLTSIALPVIVAYLFLQARGARMGTNASYDAYKLFAVFYPLLLPVFCWWVTLRRSRKLHEWLLVCSVAAVVLAFNLLACGMFVFRMCRPPLIVDGELRQLRRIDAMPDVKSVNMLIPDMWSRLWANAFLLRKQQYFLTHTYEGRLNTPLRGDWDLEGGLSSVRLANDGTRQITSRFALVNTRHPEFVRVEMGDGWHPEEFNSRTGERWQWTKGPATLRLLNPHPYSLRIACTIDGWSAEPRALALTTMAKAPGESVMMSTTRGRVTLRAVEVPPGSSTLVLRSKTPPTVVPGDPRPLGIAVFRFEVGVRR